MPTFKSYVNDDGYYINARPSDVGNITYQVDADASDFILELGYEHEDELPWGIVKPLRVVGLVYTNSQGVSEDDEGVPGLDPSKLALMSVSERKELLEYLKGRGDLPSEVIDELRSQIAKERSDREILTDAIKEELDGPGLLGNEVHVTISNSDGGTTNTSITIKTRTGLSPNYVSHEIQALGSPEVDEWFVHHEFGEGWEGATKAAEAKIPIMKALESVSDELSFEFHSYKESESFL